MHDGTYETIDGRPAVCFERRFAHPVEKVWRAVTEPAELAHWFPAQVTVDLRLGGAVSFKFKPEEQLPPSTGEVTELEPPRRFAFTWDEDLLRFELEPEDGGSGCSFRFTHLLADSETAARNAAGWEVCLAAMEQRLAGAAAEAPSSAAGDDWEGHYEAYVERGFPSGAPIPGRS
jgi:uncharacterized protein YndB with AHSA1/START domain